MLRGKKAAPFVTGLSRERWEPDLPPDDAKHNHAREHKAPSDANQSGQAQAGRARWTGGPLYFGMPA